MRRREFGGRLIGAITGAIAAARFLDTAPPAPEAIPQVVPATLGFYGDLPEGHHLHIRYVTDEMLKDVKVQVSDNGTNWRML